MSHAFPEQSRSPKLPEFFNRYSSEIKGGITVASLGAFILLGAHMDGESDRSLEATESCITTVMGRHDDPIELPFNHGTGLSSRPAAVTEELFVCNQSDRDPLRAMDILGVPFQHRPALEINNVSSEQ